MGRVGGLDTWRHHTFVVLHRAKNFFFLSGTQRKVLTLKSGASSRLPCPLSTQRRDLMRWRGKKLTEYDVMWVCLLISTIKKMEKSSTLPSLLLVSSFCIVREFREKENATEEERVDVISDLDSSFFSVPLPDTRHTFRDFMLFLLFSRLRVYLSSPSLFFCQFKREDEKFWGKKNLL